MTREEPPLFSVTEVNGIVRDLLEEEFADVRISGELSNVRVHASGHVYFRLKDENAQLPAVCFRGDARSLGFEPQDGMQVIARGRLTVYDVQGTYQMVTRSMVPSGRGELERAYRLLLAKLEAEGLFDPARKRPLPRYPSTVAVVTSPTGAAIRDILSTLARRFPCADVLFVPVVVQGEFAAPSLVRALDALSERGDADVIIVGRGGGSIEDLWAFNDEGVARAIHRCSIPVISAVGHEQDVTIADHVADRRAATPTMAAEIAVPDRADVARRIGALDASMAALMRGRVRVAGARVSEMLRSYALGRVRGRIEQQMQVVDFCGVRLAQAARARVKDGGSRLELLAGRLESLDARAVLRRGFALCVDPASGRPVRNADDALRGGAMHVRFAESAVGVTVTERIALKEST